MVIQRREGGRGVTTRPPPPLHDGAVLCFLVPGSPVRPLFFHAKLLPASLENLPAKVTRVRQK